MMLKIMLLNSNIELDQKSYTQYEPPNSAHSSSTITNKIKYQQQSYASVEEAGLVHAASLWNLAHLWSWKYVPWCSHQ